MSEPDFTQDSNPGLPGSRAELILPPHHGIFKEKALALESENLVLNPNTHMLYDLG